ncbi:hypothetical protein [Actinoplanes derwentensis]|uniref:Uncharacterized protein n=1 Tax=Actinoplanes derwentensis TaxID=113562 RepID=A0A1H1PT26_9ACTN|nr:hypothetical protein [Actinoplanes derwentensis]GID88422.1 hypothetical protein Ade03nite_73460 [Actinoplanes derwentensis]SDS14422.1 hypothetical protein SAMN04489716_0110 [Actinoplanes derwentensis]
MGSTRLLIAGVTLAMTLTGATPAAATPIAAPATGMVPGVAPVPDPEMDFTVTPREATPGTTVVLSGVAGILDRNSGNAGRVDFYFLKAKKGTPVLLGSTTASSSGKFRWVTKATASGDYSAEYRHQKQEIVASASDYLTVYTHRVHDQMLYSWTASKLSCLPSCKTVGPEQFVDPAPVHVELTRDCLQPRSGGRIGFARDAKSAFTPGAPGWRDFPEGRGPASFDLNPGLTKGRFYFEWTSAPAPQGELTSCNLSFTASQKVLRKEYL